MACNTGSLQTSSIASNRAHADSPAIIVMKAGAIGRLRRRHAKAVTIAETTAAMANGIACGLGWNISISIPANRAAPYFARIGSEDLDPIN
jgi:hypothetical protein